MVHKRGSLYYMVYAAFGPTLEQNIWHILTSKSATGPWEYQGVIVAIPGGCYTNHPGVVDFYGTFVSVLSRSEIKGRQQLSPFCFCGRVYI